MKPDLTIQPATQGGYIVIRNNLREGYRWEPLFAGTLEDCLSFLRNFYQGEVH